MIETNGLASTTNRNSMIDAVIWDMGGVLVRTEDQTPRRELAAWVGTTDKELYDTVFNSPTALQATLGLIPEEEQWKAVQAHYGLKDEDMPRFRDLFWGGDRLDDRLVAFIDSLRPRYRTALLSNAWSETRDEMNRRHKLLHAFDVSVFSAEIQLAKPDPAAFLYLLGLLSVSPERAVFVDDVSHNVEGAVRLGMHGIVFRNSHQALRELAQLGVSSTL
ncbi:MAG: HAD family phosphatase [Anaerolineaceae bacterium]